MHNSLDKRASRVCTDGTSTERERDAQEIRLS